MPLPPVLIELKALSGNLTAKIGEAKAELTGLEATGNARMAGLAKAGMIAAAAVAAIGVAVIAVGAVTAKMAMDFQESTTQLVTGAGESEAQIDNVRKGILAMAGSVGTMPEELSKGMYLIGSAGYHGAQGLSVLKAAAQGAKVGGAEMAVVANGLTTAMTDYNIPATRANAVTSALVATTASGKMHMQDLANSLGMVMPKASALGVSFQGVTGALATMTSAGMTARRASMNLASTIVALGAPGKSASKALESVGLSAQKVKDDLSKKGLQGTLEEITDAVGNKFPKGSVAAVTALKSILGGTQGYGTALALTGTHAKAFEANVKNIGAALNGQSKNVAGFALTQKDLAFQMQSAKAGLSALGITVGTTLLPALTSGMNGMNSFIQSVQKSFGEGGISKVFTDIGARIKAALPGIQAQLAEWGTAFWTWIQVAGPPMLVKLGELLTQLGTWLVTIALPAIATKLVAWGKAFVEWIEPQIPPALAKLGDLLVALGNWILTVALPTIGSHLLEWGLAFVKWIGPMIPPVLAAMGGLLVKLLGWIWSTALPAIVGKLGEWAKAFFMWVPGAIVGLLKALIPMLGQLGTWIVSTAAPQLVTKLMEWSKAFASWILTATIEAPGKLLKLLGTVISWAASVGPKILSTLGDLSGLLRDAGMSIIRGLLGGITAKFEEVKNFISGIGSWIASHKGPLSYDRELLVPHGAAIMAGFNDSLMTGFGKVQGNVAGMADQLSSLVQSPTITVLGGTTSGGRASGVVSDSSIGGTSRSSGSSADTGNTDIVSAIQELGELLKALHAAIRALPKDYQMGQRGQVVTSWPR